MKQGATDLHAQADRRCSFRVDGKLRRIPPEQFAVPTNDGIVEMLREAFSRSIHDRIEKQQIPSNTFSSRIIASSSNGRLESTRPSMNM